MKKIFVYGDPEKFHNYSEALKGCGAGGVFSTELAHAQACDGLLLPGGADIDPALYGAENLGSKGIDRERDLAEIELIRIFSEAGKPILGICKGLQILNVAFGGDLIQDIPTAAAHRWEEETGDKVHLVTASDDSLFAHLYGRTFPVNSAHHQAVRAVAPCFSIAARAADGVIEALENCEKHIYAVQWHPERMAFHNARTDTVDGRHIFAYFLELC